MASKQKQIGKTCSLKEACVIVERHCRQLGKDCQVTFNNQGVEIAPLSWPGSSTGDTLYEALIDAESSEE